MTRNQQMGLAEEMARAQTGMEGCLGWDVGLVRQHLASTADLIRKATPEELHRIYSDLFQIVFDLEARTGEVYLKFSPEHRRRFALGGDEGPDRTREFGGKTPPAPGSEPWRKMESPVGRRQCARAD